jgi:hypothetical protein
LVSEPFDDSVVLVDSVLTADSVPTVASESLQHSPPLPSLQAPSLPSQQAASLPSQQALLAATVTTFPSLHSPSLPSQHDPSAATALLLSQQELLAATTLLLSQHELVAATALPLGTQQPFWSQHAQLQVPHGQTPVSMQQVPSIQQVLQSLAPLFFKPDDVSFSPLPPLRLAAPAIAATVATTATKPNRLTYFFMIIFP